MYAVYCSVLQCNAVCGSVLQCVAVCCSVLHYIAVLCSALKCVATCCSVLQCVAVSCSVLHCNAACCSVLQCFAESFSVLQRVAVALQCVAEYGSVLQCVAAWCSVLQCAAVCCSMMQCVAMFRNVLQRNIADTCIHGSKCTFYLQPKKKWNVLFTATPAFWFSNYLYCTVYVRMKKTVIWWCAFIIALRAIMQYPHFKLIRFLCWSQKTANPRAQSKMLWACVRDVQIVEYCA